ncbi:Hpt domain-containing protein [Pseudomonas synxantha]|uniref:HPt (Histidine-containing phosphotransfer) domain-containing protein n=1 Tax=Pseudomonas synxantha TaxID=47883 RepID=A0ACC6JT15_9PSED|nr:Hpt domain-containing protein [Pseudomonas synxantha]MDR6609682.1 HPt (histidine-containing phosphotransfer) domain-containing protein [Pseudomonas synxantha]
MDDKHVDRDVLSALREVMEEGYRDLLDVFLADSEERLKVLRTTDSAALLVETAHSFKGSSSNMGALRLTELCDQLEQQARSLPCTAVQELVGEIDREFAGIRPLYEAERQRCLAKI